MKVAIFNWNDIIPDLSKHFEVVKAVDFLEADAIIAAHEADPTQGSMIDTAREYGIPTFSVQHGRFATSDYTRNNKQPRGDYFLVWGDFDAEEALKGGWKKDQVIKIGSLPLRDRVTPKPDGKTVVFVPAHIEALASSNANNDDEALQIWDIIRNMKGINPVIKLLAGEHPMELIHGERFITHRSDIGHIKRVYKKLLKKASCVVSQAEGTFELLAYSMDIPVVRVKPYDTWPTAADVVGDIKYLEDGIRTALEHPEINRAERKRIVEHEGGGLHCDSVTNLVNIVKGKTLGRAMRAARKDECKVITYFLKEMNEDNYYRIVLPMDKIAEHDSEIAIKKIVKGETDARLANGLITDMLALPPVGEPKMIDMAYRLKEYGKKVSFDFNENIFDVSPFSPKYHRYGQNNVRIKDTDFWVDGKNIDLFSNKVYVENVIMGLGIADVVTAPTQALAEVYSKYSDNVKVISTSVDMKIWKKLPMIKNGVIRMGWHGGAESVEDITMISEAIARVMHANPKVVLVMLGSRFTDTLKDLPQDRIEHHTPVNFEAMPYKMAALNLDIGLLPHKETEFSKFKTPVKWIEYASLEVPTVCSFTYPYDTMPDNAGIFIDGNDTDGWVEGINTLIEDRILASKIAGEARREVEDKFDINKNYIQWADAYRGLFN